jgi:hypothetical protein
LAVLRGEIEGAEVHLTEWMKAEDRLLTERSAFAAAALGMEAAYEIIKAMATRPPVPEANMPAYTSPIAAAVYLLGKLKLPQALPCLEEIMSQNKNSGYSENTAEPENEMRFLLYHLAENEVKAIS